MGCTNCRSSSDPESEILSRIKECIQQDNHNSLDSLIKLLSFHYKIEIPLILNKPLIKMENFYGNFLCYALSKGKVKVFNYLLKNLNCSLSDMEELFIDAKLDPMTILCQKGHINLLKAYLPEYLQSFQN